MAATKVSGWELIGTALALGAPIPALMGWQVPVQIVAACGVAGATAAAYWLIRPSPEQTVNDRDSATYIIGRRRSGKTTLASLMFARDTHPHHTWRHFARRYSATNPRGAAWITTHGARDIAAIVPPDRLSLISPPHTRGLNILQGTDPYGVANRVVTVIRRMYPDLGSVQTPMLYTAALTVAEERRDATLWDVYRFCDGERRQYEMHSEVAQRQWADPEKTAVRGLVARLGRMLSSPRLSRGIADPQGYDLDEEVRQNRVIVADLVQDDTADALVLAQAIIAMLQQVSVRRGKNAQMYPVYADEFQSYADDSITIWLEEGGKRHMPLSLVHQSREQLSPKLKSATLSSGTIYAFALNIHDAKEVAPELGIAQNEAQSLTALPTRTYHARILSHGRVVYRKARVPYVDAARRADQGHDQQARRNDDDAGAASLLPRPVGAEDGAG